MCGTRVLESLWFAWWLYLLMSERLQCDIALILSHMSGNANTENYKWCEHVLKMSSVTSIM